MYGSPLNKEGGWFPSSEGFTHAAGDFGTISILQISRVGEPGFARTTHPPEIFEPDIE